MGELVIDEGVPVFVVGLGETLHVILKRHPACQWAGPIEEPS